MPKVSVIIPAYNASNFIVRCVESIQKQTFQDLEIIVINDGSLDNTRELVSEIAKSDSRVRCVTIKNSGPGPARNKGIELAKGQYVAFVDADDYIAPTMIEDLLECCEEHNVNVAIGKVVSSSKEDYAFREKSKNKVLINGISASEKVLNNACGFNFTHGKLYRTDFVKKHNIVFSNIPFSEDVLFNIKVFLNTSEVIFIDEEVYCYFNNLDSITNTYDKNRDQYTFLVLSEIEKMINRTNNNILERHFATYVFYSITYLILNEIKNPDISNYKKLFFLRSSTTYKNFRRYLILSNVKGIKNKIMKTMLYHKLYIIPLLVIIVKRVSSSSGKINQ